MNMMKRLERAAEEYRSGYSVKAIVRKYGLNGGQFYKTLKELGVPLRNNSDHTKKNENRESFALIKKVLTFNGDEYARQIEYQYSRNASNPKKCCKVVINRNGIVKYCSSNLPVQVVRVSCQDFEDIMTDAKK